MPISQWVSGARFDKCVKNSSRLPHTQIHFPSLFLPPTSLSNATHTSATRAPLIRYAS